MGTFGRVSRFDSQASIYKNVFSRTTNKVGPGAYKEEDVVHLLRKKPCMTTIHRPEINENEEFFEMQGHTRILQANYLPKERKEEFVSLVEKLQSSLGRKVHDTLAFRRANFHQTMSMMKSTQSLAGRKSS